MQPRNQLCCAAVRARSVISSDKHIIKVWDASSGAGFTSIEPAEGDINDVCVWPGSGASQCAAARPPGCAALRCFVWCRAALGW